MRGRTFSLAVSIALSGAPGSAAPQSADSQILMPEPPSAANVSVEQLQFGSDRGVGSETEAGADRRSSVEPPAQLSGTRDDTPLRQVAPAGVSAEAAPALSHRSEGRPEPAVPIAGEDRCDRERKRPAPQANCANVIENRAAEFAGKQSAQSAEQRLLLNVTQPTDDGLARNLKSIGANPDARTSQELASVVLQPAPRPNVPNETPSEALDATLSQILESLKIINPSLPSN